MFTNLTGCLTASRAPVSNTDGRCSPRWRNPFTGAGGCPPRASWRRRLYHTVVWPLGSARVIPSQVAGPSYHAGPTCHTSGAVDLVYSIQLMGPGPKLTALQLTSRGLPSRVLRSGGGFCWYRSNGPSGADSGCRGPAEPGEWYGPNGWIISPLCWLPWVSRYPNGSGGGAGWNPLGYNHSRPP